MFGMGNPQLESPSQAGWRVDKLAANKKKEKRKEKRLSHALNLPISLNSVP